MADLEIARKENLEKWLGEGAKGLVGPASKGLPRVFFATAKPSVAPSASHFRVISLFGKISKSVDSKLGVLK